MRGITRFFPGTKTGSSKSRSDKKRIAKPIFPSYKHKRVSSIRSIDKNVFLMLLLIGVGTFLAVRDMKG